MNKKILTLSAAILVVACSSGKKPDYVVTDFSVKNKPIWIESISKFEKKKDNENDEYKYFKSESESIDKRLCEKSAIANTNIEVAAEINTEVYNMYNGLSEVQREEILVSNDKKEETKNLVRSKLSGVELRDSYWEKRKYKAELGAANDKDVYYCYQLARVKRDTHDKIINEMINKKIKDIKDENLKESVKKVVETNADNADIDIDIK